MKRFAISLFFLIHCSSSFAGINEYFNRIKTDPNALYSFLKTMPKGGELHYHLAGGAYPEAMLDLVIQGNYCVDKSFSISKTATTCEGFRGKEIGDRPTFYGDTLRAWSLKDFVATSQESNADHFFGSFSKFMPIVFDKRAELLAEVMQRAANQQEVYLEIMILPDNGNSLSFGPANFDINGLDLLHKDLIKNPSFVKNVQRTADEAANLLKQARQRLGCENNSIQAVCQIKVKFQYYVLREQPLEKLFAQALNAFAAAAISKELVAVNLVQPEYGYRALHDYSQQMRIFQFMHSLYPKVHISLHAGEFAFSDVNPEHLRFHIHDAIAVGQAERIGHGVDISFENNAEVLLQTMAKKQIAVEINLISNKKLLHVSGPKHPLKQYLRYKVPVVLSTDDEGLLRTDLTQQYVEAVLAQGLDYATLKQISRNALTYSFLTGQNLWEKADQAIAVSDCHNLDSQSCLNFVNHNEKAQLQRELEKRFIEFEKGF